jgi:aryl-alcohol dehydrogenase-like predicted oxidoreductase
MKELIDEGKINYYGLSEVTPDEIKRAHAIHPVCCLELEWSLANRDLEAEIVPLARELGIGILAYSPLGRGILTNKLDVKQLEEGDWRKTTPRFEGKISIL